MAAKFKIYRDGLGTLVGMIFGAGIFGLPFAFAQAGIFWGFLHFGIALFLMFFFHLTYGEIAFLTDGQMRFTGYVRKFLGRRAEFLAFLTTIFGYYGALLAYGILGGIFLKVFLPHISVLNSSLLFFAAAAAFSLFHFKSIGTLNFYLTIPIFIFIIYLFFLSAPSFELGNFLTGSAKSWLLPYGVWLFALGGFAAIPEARDIMKGATLVDFKKVIVWSLLICSIFYLIFIVAVLGASGAATTQDALTGLGGRTGRIAVLTGSLVGFFAVFTSYIALAADLQNIYIFDYGRSRFFSWWLAVLAAPVLFVSGVTNLVKVLEVTGAVGLGVFGIFVIEMARRFHRVYPQHRHFLLGPKKWLRWVLILCLLAGVFLEIAYLLNLL